MLAVALVLGCGGGEEGDGGGEGGRRLREVRLAGGKVEIAEGEAAFPAGFAEKQTPSARGTVAYAVAGAEPVGAGLRARLAEIGVRVRGYLPENAMLAEADEAGLERLKGEAGILGAYEFAGGDKTSRRLKVKLARGGTAAVAIATFEEGDAVRVEEWVRGRGGEVLPYRVEGRKGVRARLGAEDVEAAAKLGEVRWIEEYRPMRLLSDMAVAPERMNAEVTWRVHGLTGQGQTVTVTDSGLDTGEIGTLNADFAGQVLGLRASCAETETGDYFGHGTHVAGLLAGTGANSGGRYKGAAHGAKLLVWGCVNKDGTMLIPGLNVLTMDNLFEMGADKRSWISSGSWGAEGDGKYDLWCKKVDAYLWMNPDKLLVMAIGNNECGGLATPGMAKNCIGVGASGRETPALVVGCSSYGPTADGRTKPDLCAPGTNIVSVRSALSGGNGNYRVMSGTSMATPLAAGAAAIVRQWLMERKGVAQPTAALIKAALTGGAVDMSREAGGDGVEAAPGARQGWGRLNLGETIYPTNAAVRVWDRVPFAEGEVQELELRTTRTGRLDVQLAWTDYPGEESAAKALVNDLDLEVLHVESGQAWRGNGGAAEEGGWDRVNTLEGVRIADAAPGRYVVRVIGARVPYGSVEGGAAAVWARGKLPEHYVPFVITIR